MSNCIGYRPQGSVYFFLLVPVRTFLYFNPGSNYLLQRQINIYGQHLRAHLKTKIVSVVVEENVLDLSCRHYQFVSKE